MVRELFWLRIGAAILTSVLFVADFTIARTSGGQIDFYVASAWLLALGWVFGGGVRDALSKRNGNGGGDG